MVGAGASALALGDLVDQGRQDRVEVTDDTEVERWVNVRRFHRWASELESAPGAMPMHWWVATEPVPVKAATA